MFRLVMVPPFCHLQVALVNCSALGGGVQTVAPAPQRNSGRGDRRYIVDMTTCGNSSKSGLKSGAPFVQIEAVHLIASLYICEDILRSLSVLVFPQGYLNTVGYV